MSFSFVHHNSFSFWCHKLIEHISLSSMLVHFSSWRPVLNNSSALVAKQGISILTVHWIFTLTLNHAKICHYGDLPLKVQNVNLHSEVILNLLHQFLPTWKNAIILYCLAMSIVFLSILHYPNYHHHLQISISSILHLLKT